MRLGLANAGIREAPWDCVIQNFIDSCPGNVEIWERFGKCFRTPVIFIIIKRNTHLAPYSFYWHPLKGNARIDTQRENKRYQTHSDC